MREVGEVGELEEGESENADVSVETTTAEDEPIRSADCKAPNVLTRLALPLTNTELFPGCADELELLNAPMWRFDSAKPVRMHLESIGSLGTAVLIEAEIDGGCTTSWRLDIEGEPQRLTDKRCDSLPFFRKIRTSEAAGLCAAIEPPADAPKRMRTAPGRRLRKNR